MKKKTLIWINIVLLLFVIIAGIFLSWPYIKKIKTELTLQEVSLEALRWTDISSFLTARSFNQENNTDTLDIYRVQDGKVQNLQGIWNFSYAHINELLVFGHSYKTPDTQKLFVIGDKFSKSKDISELPGEITNISQNPKGTYFLITGIDKNSTSTKDYYSCIGEKLTPGPKPCPKILGDIIKDYDKTLLYQSFWNLENEREIITLEKGGQGRIWSFDPWEDKPVLVTNTAEKVIQATAENSIPKYPTKSYLGGRILSIQTSETKHKLFFIPGGSEIKWLNETHFALIEKDKKVFIYDIEARQRAFLVQLPSDAKNITTYYSNSEK
jgi:hypothetical protein